MPNGEHMRWAPNPDASVSADEHSALRQRLERTENALAGAICIVRNDAVYLGRERQAMRRRWCDEWIQESGIDFGAVMERLETQGRT